MQSANGVGKKGPVVEANPKMVSALSPGLAEVFLYHRFACRNGDQERSESYTLKPVSTNGNCAVGHCTLAEMLASKLPVDEEPCRFIQYRVPNMPAAATASSAAKLRDMLTDFVKSPGDIIDLNFAIGVAFDPKGNFVRPDDDVIRACFVDGNAGYVIMSQGVTQRIDAPLTITPQLSQTTKAPVAGMIMKRFETLQPHHSLFMPDEGWLNITHDDPAFHALRHVTMSSALPHVNYYEAIPITVSTSLGDITVYPAIVDAVDGFLRGVAYAVQGFKMDVFPIPAGLGLLFRKLALAPHSPLRSESLRSLIEIFRFLAEPNLDECSAGPDTTPDDKRRGWDKLKPWSACLDQRGKADFFALAAQFVWRVKHADTRGSHAAARNAVHLVRMAPLLPMRIFTPTGHIAHPEGVELYYAPHGDSVGYYSQLFPPETPVKPEPPKSAPPVRSRGAGAVPGKPRPAVRLPKSSFPPLVAAAAPAISSFTDAADDDEPPNSFGSAISSALASSMSFDSKL